MFVAPYRSDKPYDEYLEKTFMALRDHIDEKDDDFLCLTIGQTGTGKSSLNFHILSIFVPEDRLSINQVALSREEFAVSFKKVTTGLKPRALLYDEANVSKRDSMTQFNKDVIDLYLTCRGLNTLHLWANPTLKLIDTAFVEDRIRAVILVRGKDTKRPRVYYWFRKEDILKIYNKYNTLSLTLLNRVRKKYAWYRGWFKDYTGSLKEEYLEKKNNRMNAKVDKFYEKYGEEVSFSKSGVVMKELGVSEPTLAKYRKLLDFGVHYQITATGNYHYTREGIEQLRKLLAQGSQARRSGLV